MRKKKKHPKKWEKNLFEGKSRHPISFIDARFKAQGRAKTPEGEWRDRNRRAGRNARCKYTRPDGTVIYVPYSYIYGSH